MRPSRVPWHLAVSVALIGGVVPPQPAAPQAMEAVRRDLDAALSTYRWRTANWGVLVVSLDVGDTIFAVSPDSAMAPASNMKLLTTAAALRELGPDFRFRTYLMTDDHVEEGVVTGDLVLYGTGDPGISDRFYSHRNAVFGILVDQLVARGIHTIAGNLIADASYFPGPYRPEGWDPEDLNEHFTGAVSALSYNENVVSLRVQPGRFVGARPMVTTLPEPAGLDFVNHGLTVQSVTERLAIIRLDPMEPIQIEGQIPRNSRDVWRQMTVSSPALFAVTAFRAVLEERGINVNGDIRVNQSPAQSVVARVAAPAVPGQRGARVLARHDSPPLRDYLEVVNKQSNNLFAELIFRTVGRVAEGVGSPDASARGVAKNLEALSVPMQGTRMLDGSGLSAGNRVSAATFVALLAGVSRSPFWNEFWESLPEAGRRDGLSRMYRTAAAGNLRAKTGTIANVSALSGVVRSRDGERLAFSILVNGTPSTARAKRVENLLGERLASFSRGADAVSRANVDATSVIAGAETASPTASTEGGRHRIRAGESLGLIARRYGVTVSEVLRSNPGLTGDRIFTGEWITIPQRGGG